MSIEVFLDDVLPGVIIFKFGKFWTWEDYQLAIDQAVELSEPIAESVDQLIDFRECVGLPKGSAATHLARGRRVDSKTRHTVYIGKASYMQMLYRVMSIEFNEDSPNLVETIEAARARLLDLRATSQAESEAQHDDETTG